MFSEVTLQLFKGVSVTSVCGQTVVWFYSYFKWNISVEVVHWSNRKQGTTEQVTYPCSQWVRLWCMSRKASQEQNNLWQSDLYCLRGTVPFKLVTNQPAVNPDLSLEALPDCLMQLPWLPLHVLRLQWFLYWRSILYISSLLQRWFVPQRLFNMRRDVNMSVCLWLTWAEKTVWQWKRFLPRSWTNFHFDTRHWQKCSITWGTLKPALP